MATMVAMLSITREVATRTVSVEVATRTFNKVVVRKVGRMEKVQMQLRYSCSTAYNINQVWADPSNIILQARASDSITALIMQPEAECKLCEVLEAHLWVTMLIHTTGQVEEDDKTCDMMPATTCQMWGGGHSIVLSMEYRVEKVVYEVSSKQCHVLSLQCVEANEMDKKGMCMYEVSSQQTHVSSQGLRNNWSWADFATLQTVDKKGMCIKAMKVD